MLVLVVGPSGAGKDTLLGAARRALASDLRFVFARRAITRPADPDGENHDPLTPDAFAARAAAGGFALQWQAHGLSYGIPTEAMTGEVVIANVSRAVIADAATRFPTRVIEITAPAALLAERLDGRGREDAADIAERLARQVALPSGVAVETIVNDGSADAGAARLVTLLRRAAAGAPRS